MKKASYIPIDCNYYDKLEAWAVLRQEVEVVFLQESEKEEVLRGLIEDFFIEEGAEYMKMKDGKSLRLDRLVAVNGEAVPKSC
jgi:Rho-binding antiterminator